MKKILSVFAAAAMLLGFASCSGDLHDDVKAPIDLSTGYYLVGNMNGWNEKEPIAFEDNTEVPGTYVVKFQATEAEIAFAFIPQPGKWDGQIGGNLMVAGTLPANAKYESKDNGNGGFNGTVSGLEVKANYKMVVTPNDDGTLKLDVSSNVPPTPVYLHNMYVRGPMIDWAPSVAGSLKFSNLDIAKGIVTYYVDFVCTDTANKEYGIVDASGNWSVKYTGANVTVGEDYVVTTKGASDNNFITGLVNGKNYRIYIKTTPDGNVYTKVAELISVNISIKGCKLINFESEDAIYFLEGWVPGNDWGANSPNKGNAVSGTTVVDFSTPYNYSFIGEVAEFNAATLKIQIIEFANKENFWADGNKVCGGADIALKDCESGKTYYLVYDKDSEEGSFVEVK